MVDAKTREFLERMVREYLTPDNLNPGLKIIEAQLGEATGNKRIVLEGFRDGIRQVLGKVS